MGTLLTAPATLLTVTPRIIGIHGFKRAGKDSTGDWLNEHFGHQGIAFATPVKRVVYIVNSLLPSGRRVQGFVDEHGWEGIKELTDPMDVADYLECRRLQQATGTDAGREVLGIDIWADKARDLADEGNRFMFTDVRFDNEAQVVHDMGGFVLEIVRPGLVSDGHSSERRISAHLIDATVINKGRHMGELHEELGKIFG